MTDRKIISFEVHGEKFTPSILSLPFTSSHDPGVIGTKGRYSGVPVPYGAASYVLPATISECAAFAHLADLFEPEIQRMRDAGASTWWVSIGRFYSAQCNEAYSVDQLRQLLRLECGFSYSAYHEELGE